MRILVLYSWEEERRETDQAQSWAMALCEKLCCYDGVEATCDMLFSPKSNVIEDLKQKINSAEKILVIITKSYNRKIASATGVASVEEQVYRERKNKNGSNDILFIKKESGVDLPDGWKDYNRLDFSWINSYQYKQKSVSEQWKCFDKIIGFFDGTPEFALAPKANRRKHPTPQKVSSFEKLYSRPTAKAQLKQQENALVKFIKTNMNQESFIFEYIRSGLSADINLNGRMTVDVFSKHFLVNRPAEEEQKYNNIVGQLFKDPLKNMLCVQSDGGSGKSVFLHTLYKRDEKRSSKYNYTNIFFDLAYLHMNTLAKEELLFQRLKKEYRQMSLGDIGGSQYHSEWRKNFLGKTEELRNVNLPDDPYLFKLIEFQDELNSAIDSLLPKHDLDDWYIGFSRRIHEMKSQMQSKNVFFVIMLLLYILILDSRPTPSKEERFVFIFDNIETYDNGENTYRIARFIQSCHSFIKATLLEIGLRDNFFKKFTFVTVLRTSTFVSFGSLQTSIWGQNKYIIHLKYVDFTVEALLKKLKFLEEIPSIKESVLYNSLFTLLSLLIPKKEIVSYLTTGKDDLLEIKHYASHQLLPMFNNNFRNAMEYLYHAVFCSDYHVSIKEYLQDIDSNKLYYSNAINGVRMIIFRYIFDEFKHNGYFRDIGFPDLHGIEDHSMTRMVLAYLYWDNVSFCATHPDLAHYKGVTLDKLVNTFRFFCEADKLYGILYGLSIYTKRNPQRWTAINAWGNLLNYETEGTAVDEDVLNQEIHTCITGASSTNAENIYVRLSSAGICFTRYFIRSFEFLQSRNMNLEETKPLFLLNEKGEIATCLSGIRVIINNCIEKLLSSCEKSCDLCKGSQSDCVFKNKHMSASNQFSIFSCSLFIRCQECIDLIRESMDYIDRFRVTIVMNTHDHELNNMLLDQITTFYKLFDSVRNKLYAMSEAPQKIDQFINNWVYPSNQPLNAASKKFSNSERLRLIQMYYTRSDENFEKAIDIARKHEESTKSLYDVITEMSARAG